MAKTLEDRNKERVNLVIEKVKEIMPEVQGMIFVVKPKSKGEQVWWTGMSRSTFSMIYLAIQDQLANDKIKSLIDAWENLKNKEEV